MPNTAKLTGPRFMIIGVVGSADEDKRIQTRELTDFGWVNSYYPATPESQRAIESRLERGGYVRMTAEDTAMFFPSLPAELFHHEMIYWRNPSAKGGSDATTP